MAIRWADSADKHGVAHEDALNAIDKHVYYWIKAFDEPRVPGHVRPDLFIGPTRDRGMLPEDMVEITPPANI